MINQVRKISKRRGVGFVWKKVVKEILIITIAYVILFIYGYYNDSKKWAWLVSAIIVFIVYGTLRLSEYIKKKKDNKDK